MFSLASMKSRPAKSRIVCWLIEFWKQKSNSSRVLYCGNFAFSSRFCRWVWSRNSTVTGNWLQYLGAETGALGSGFWGLVGLDIGKNGKTVFYASLNKKTGPTTCLAVDPIFDCLSAVGARPPVGRRTVCCAYRRAQKSSQAIRVGPPGCSCKRIGLLLMTQKNRPPVFPQKSNLPHGAFMISLKKSLEPV